MKLILKRKMDYRDLPHFRFDSKAAIVFKGTPVELKGNLLFCWPYRWETDTHSDLVSRLGADVKNWITKVDTCATIGVKWTDQINDVALSTTYFAPQIWIRDACQNDTTYAKLLTLFKAIYLTTFLDDCTDTNVLLEQPPTIVYLNLAKLIYKICLFKISSIEEMQNQDEFNDIVKIFPKTETSLKMAFDLSKTLKYQFDATQETAKHFAMQFRYFFELRIWGQEKNTNHVISSGLQQYRRVLSSGFTPLLEIVFLLNGSAIPAVVRENAYWSRCWYVAGFLLGRVNDIISLEKELLEFEKFKIVPDNIILNYLINENCTFDLAIERTLREHNDALKEFNETVSFLQTYPDHLFDLNDDMKECFLDSLNTIGEFISRSVQAHVIIKRYLKNIEFKIE
ncbi:unnamed protein product [Allacma fusca]|uniref:Terpene synthase n=1 Tax=Allacma fusca TaxID=39272 RepID=A0A8J2KSX0_9HEXA|nr:unnamed protein product [Allacma fusca]